MGRYSNLVAYIVASLILASLFTGVAIGIGHWLGTPLPRFLAVLIAVAWFLLGMLVFAMGNISGKADEDMGYK